MKTIFKITCLILLCSSISTLTRAQALNEIDFTSAQDFAKTLNIRSKKSAVSPLSQRGLEVRKDHLQAGDEKTLWTSTSPTTLKHNSNVDKVPEHEEEQQFGSYSRQSKIEKIKSVAEGILQMKLTELH